MSRKLILVLCAVLVSVACADGPATRPGDGFALQTAILEAQTPQTLWDAVHAFKEANAPENLDLWPGVAADRNRPYATRCYAMEAVFTRVLHRGDDLHEVVKRLGIAFWFQPSQIGIWHAGQNPFEEFLSPNSSVFVVHLPNETDRKFGVYIEVRGRISVEQLAAGVADGQPKIVVTKIAPCAVPFNDMGIRGGPTTAPTKPESQHR